MSHVTFVCFGLQKGTGTIEKRTPRGFDSGGLKLTGDLRDENTGNWSERRRGEEIGWERG